MAKPKVTSYAEVERDLPKTYCDINPCGQMAELIVKDDNNLWIFFCGKHNPHKMKTVYPKGKLKNKK